MISLQNEDNTHTQFRLSRRTSLGEWSTQFSAQSHSEWITGWSLFCTHYLTEVLQKPHEEATLFRVTQTHIQVNEKMLPSWQTHLVVGAVIFHLQMQKLPRYKVHSCVFMLTSIEKNLDFFLYPLPPHSHTLTDLYLAHVSRLWRWKSQREEEEDLRRWCKYFIMWQDMNTSNLIFYKIIYKIIPMLNSMISYFV